MTASLRTTWCSTDHHPGCGVLAPGRVTRSFSTTTHRASKCSAWFFVKVVSCSSRANRCFQAMPLCNGWTGRKVTAQSRWRAATNRWLVLLQAVRSVPRLWSRNELMFWLVHPGRSQFLHRRYCPENQASVHAQPLFPHNRPGVALEDLPGVSCQVLRQLGVPEKPDHTLGQCQRISRR